MDPRSSVSPVVIIGGGVAGLTAANLLTREGRSVTIFEASDKLGGCCATTTVDGYTFNDGAVYLAVISVLDHAFFKIGLNRAELLPLRKITRSFSATLPDGTVVKLGEGLDLTVTGRSVDPQLVRRELHKMMDRWQPVLAFVSKELLLRPFSTGRMIGNGWRHLHKLRGTVASEFNRLFSDEAVKSALSGSLLYSGLPADRMPASAILGVVAEMSDGFYLPEGGMGRVPQVLATSLQGRGGTIALNSNVEKIVIEGGRVRGVEVSGMGRVAASAVLSTASGMLTFGSLIQPEQVPRGVARKLRNPRLSHRAVSVQFGLCNDIASPAHSVNVLPLMKDQEEIFAQDGSEVKFPVYLVPTVTMPALAPRGGSIIEMFYPVRPDIPVDYWTDERKVRLAELAAAALARSHDLNISITRVRSPKDFLKDMHLFQGALYGLSSAVTPWGQFPHAPGIPGLFLAGQTTFPGYGVGAAMMSGIFAAEALMREA